MTRPARLVGTAGRLRARLLDPPLPARVAVAYSGGPDSTALLHATLAVAAERGLEVVALHVNHGLAVDADAWVEHGRTQCERWSTEIAPVRFVPTRATADRRAGESVETWARRARYRALAAMARAEGVGTVLLAHHQRDQAETVLLQALRGGGLAGLAAMPASAERDGIEWRRPWRDEPKYAVDHYNEDHRLTWVDDRSNRDPRHARNRLRLDVWPALTTAFGRADRALARTARWAQEARELLDEIADADLADAAREDDGALRLAPLLAMSPARRSNLLRAWLRRTVERPVSAALVAELLAGWAGPAPRTTGRWPLPDGAYLELHAGRLAHRQAAPPVGAPHGHLLRVARLRLAGLGLHPLPGWGGSLQVEPAGPGEPGLTPDDLAVLELRPRQGGERFSFGPGRPARSLKKQFQQAGVPSWRRDAPLVWVADRLVFVPQLGMDGRLGTGGAAGTVRIRLVWVEPTSPDAPDGTLDRPAPER